MGEAPVASDGDDESDSDGMDVEGARPIWPMVLFAGVALVVAAGLMRWILAPRPS
jgi:hypothetical protein